MNESSELIKSKKEKIPLLQSLKEYIELYLVMLKIGITTFGGGYAMVAVIERELGNKRHWLDPEELLDYVAIAQITPGIIAVNVSTFVGYRRKGVLGGFIGTFGTITPSLVIILIIAAILSNFMDNTYVMHAFAGIRAASCALVLNAVVNFFKKSVIDLLTLIVFICIFVLAVFSILPIAYIVLGVIAISVIFTLIFGAKTKFEDDEFKGGDEK